MVGSAGVRPCFGRHWRTVDCGQWKLTNADAPAAAQASSQPPRRHPVKGGVSRRAQRAYPLGWRCDGYKDAREPTRLAFLALGLVNGAGTAPAVAAAPVADLALGRRAGAAGGAQ